MSIFGVSVSVPADAAAAAWLRPRLGPFGTVGGLVPSGYERCARIRPAASADRDEEVALAGALARVCGRHTSTPGTVHFAIWEGYGWETTTSLYAPVGTGPVGWLRTRRLRRRGRILDARRREEVIEGLARSTTFDLPGRRYHLLSGPLSSATRIDRPDGWGQQAPDLWWPADRSWFVATDTDLDWSYVGGSEHLIGDITTALPGRSEPVEWTAPNDEPDPRPRSG